MGLTLSLMQKLGFPSVQSVSTDKVFDSFFGNKIEKFEDFHIAFINACNAFNSVMPGKRVKAPPPEDIQKCYEDWQVLVKQDPTKQDLWKEKLHELMANYVTEAKQKEDSVVVMTGMVAPAAAMVLKRSGENVPQLKKFRLNLIPDALFVPSCTVLALMGVKMLQINMTSKTPASPAAAAAVKKS